MDRHIFERYMDGRCSGQEVEQLLHWMASAEENRKEAFNMKILRSKSAYEQFADEEATGKAYRQLLRMLQSGKTASGQTASGQTASGRKASGKRRTLWRRLAYCGAACILLAVGLSLITRFIRPSGGEPQQITLLAANGETKILTLDDGSRIWLSSGSRIRYPQQFAKDRRSVTLDGKAYFEVARDTLRPFTVHTGRYTVEVLGTSFEIRSFGHESTSDVILETGSVCLSDRDGKALGRLLPGQIFEYDSRNGRFSTSNIDAALYTSWRKGVIEFDSITFEELIAVLARNYRVSISLRTSALENCTLVSSLSLTKNIREMMETLRYTVPMEYTFSSDSVIIVDAKRKPNP